MELFRELKMKHCIFILYTFLGLVTYGFSLGPNLEQKQAVFMMNYAQYVAYKLKTYNNILALEDEYNVLNNNMNFETIKDYESIDTINSLMNALYEERKLHKYRSRAEETIKRKMNQALYDSIPQATTIITGGLNPLALAINAASTAGNLFISYQQYKNQLSEIFDEKMFEYENLSEDILNDIYQNLNTYSYRLMQKYQMSDEWRLNSIELEEMFKYLKDFDAERKYFNLRTLIDDRYFQHFPMFWYHLAKAAADVSDESNALQYYNRFEEENIPIFRYDTIAVDAYKGKITLLLKANAAKNKSEIIKKLEFIEENKSDWTDWYFCALVYLELGNINRARELLEKNINILAADVDNQFLNTGYLASLYDKNSDTGSSLYDALELCRALFKNCGHEDISLKSIEDQYEKDTVAFNEVLHWFGLRPSSDVIHDLQPELEKIFLTGKSLSRKVVQVDCVIPMQWMMSSASSLYACFVNPATEETFAYIMNFDEKQSKKETKRRNEYTFVYSTGKVTNDWKEQGLYFYGLILNHPLYPVLLTYDLDLNKPKKDLLPNGVYFKDEYYEF